MADQLGERAKNDLCLEVMGRRDWLVWHHSDRVCRLAELLVIRPEFADRAVDRAALRAAALYHDAGWVLQVRQGELDARDILLRPTTDLQRQLAADWMRVQLKGLLAPASLEAAARAILFLNDRRTELLEAQVLAEADNLDSIGPHTIELMVRRLTAEGKTLADLVKAWERQEEYHYWQTRIKEGFRFDPVRALAEQRWQALRQFMYHLRQAVRLEDLTGVANPQGPNTAQHGAVVLPVQHQHHKNQ